MLKNHLYHEQQKTYLLVVMVFIVVAAVLLGLALWPERSFNQSIKFLLLITAVIDLILFWSFSQLTIKITDEFLQMSFGVFKKKILFSEIKEVEVKDYDKKDYFGYGISLGKDKTIGYVAKGGRGVRVQVKTKRYFFTTENPEQIVDILRTRINKGNMREEIRQ